MSAAAPPVLWEPSPERIEQTMLWRFLQGHGFSSYDAAWRWSVAEPEAFWTAVSDFFAVGWDVRPDRFLADARMPGAVWCPGGRVSYAEHVFRDRDPDAVALHHASELRELGVMSWAQLAALSARIAAALRREGVVPGDRVVAYLPNIPEAVAALLACASIGAIWSSCSPDFGVSSVVDRFAQIEPTVLLAVDGYRYGGEDFDRRDVVTELQDAMPTLRRSVLLAYLDADATLAGTVGWDAWLADGESPTLSFTPLAFDHPLWVLYSSGTTGLPKAIVHGQGGILLEQLKQLGLHADARPGDRMLWFTTTGWMMWNFLIGAMLTGAEIVLYDGSPGTPDLNVLWELAARTRATTFGTSAAFLGSCRKAGLTPAADHDLTALRAVGSTGSPLSPESFEWVYDEVGSDLWLYSTSGGTDVCTAFVGGVPILPVHRGELQARALGCAVAAWDEDGRELVGGVGELVITQPMPSMPVFFWNDPSGRRLRESYFEMYPGVWRHGDWIEITPRGSAVIHGRSDATINRGGIRMGTAEIYRAVLAVDAVVDALVVDVPREGTEAWMPLFVVLRPGVALDDGLVEQLRAAIRSACSPRHVPDQVIAVAEVPRTLSGKVLEVPVKRILMGVAPEQAAARDALANPAALEPFVALARAGRASRRSRSGSRGPS
ncbi:MAG: Acetoacetyl-CoA synthetase [uncultured Solirubrobacteraceae bacterium]|uniref:Acetoacetyl-CoA synthetase n=1 Tax=uncultured Solirubrobacteraceae bacterium TaxID=1162706 RepID=A0A6J4S3C5_9ACTN|nr:MAG: Acetoacetyl-CoA synthetase [uncultured Solirubrobacteraceae bacterium]